MNLKLKIRILEKYPSQCACARDLGVESSLLSKWVRGWREPGPEMKEVLASKLDTAADELFPKN